MFQSTPPDVCIVKAAEKDAQKIISNLTLFVHQLRTVTGGDGLGDRAPVFELYTVRYFVDRTEPRKLRPGPDSTNKLNNERIESERDLFIQ